MDLQVLEKAALKQKGFKTAEEIRALQQRAGALPEAPAPLPPCPLTNEEAGVRYRERREAETRLRRYSSVSLSQRLELKNRAVAHMGGCCGICGYAKCMRAWEFHHRKRHTKQFSIAAFINAGVFKHSVEEVWEQLLTELKKCTLLCANCHREVEAGMTILPVKSKI